MLDLWQYGAKYYQIDRAGQIWRVDKRGKHLNQETTQIDSFKTIERMENAMREHHKRVRIALSTDPDLASPPQTKRDIERTETIGFEKKTIPEQRLKRQYLMRNKWKSVRFGNAKKYKKGRTVLWFEDAVVKQNALDASVLVVNTLKAKIARILGRKYKHLNRRLLKAILGSGQIKCLNH